MRVIASPTEMRAAAEDFRRHGFTLALVPTMGYFHEGHLSLMRRGRAECERLVVSLFVNPAQFGPQEDLARYPRDWERDRRLAEAEGVDVLFAPAAAEMYPEGYATYVEVERLGERLCGARRPGHFRGVATVVAKLFQLCLPTTAYFGRKDYQQALVIRRMAADLNAGVTIRVLPIIREADGLAMSSRNAYLSPAERRQATCLYRALVLAQGLFAQGERRPEIYSREMERLISAEPAARVDYVDLLDGEELTPVDAAAEGTLAAVAAFVGETRLIDNTLLGRDDPA